MEISRKILLTSILIATIFVVRCHPSLKNTSYGGGFEQELSSSTWRLTKRKAKELVVRPGVLIQHALRLVRQRRSAEYSHEEQPKPIQRYNLANLVNNRRIEENASGEDRKHLIDKRQIPDGLNFFEDYTSGGAVQVSLRSSHGDRLRSANEKASRRVKKDIRSSVSFIKISLKVSLF